MPTARPWFACMTALGCACAVDLPLPFDGGDQLDAGAAIDAGTRRDAGGALDGGALPSDAGTGADAGTAVDAGTGADAGAPPPGCGNGTLDMGEACDGTQLNGNTCATLPGLKSGALSCKVDCSGFDPAGCVAGTTRAAASCSKTDVTNAMAASSSGDTVTIPEGSCSWGNFTLAKNLVLRGAGKDKTVITLSTLSATGSANGVFRITGVTLKGGNPTIEITGGWKNFRIDHSLISSPSWVTGILVSFSDATGVIDNDEFVNARTEVYGEGNGSPAWSKPSAIGTGDAVFLESSTSDWVVYGNAIDSTAGGRWVVRHSTITNTPLENHGPCTSGMRGTRSYEIYENFVLHRIRFLCFSFNGVGCCCLGV